MRPIYVISIILSLTIYIFLIQNSLVDINVQIEKLEYYIEDVDMNNQESKRTIAVLNEKTKVKREKENILDEFELLEIDENIVEDIVKPIEPENIIIEEEIDIEEIEPQVEESLNLTDDEDDTIQKEEIDIKEIEPQIEECLNSTDEDDNLLNIKDKGNDIPTLNKVYRTYQRAGSYHFLLLDSSGSFYHLHTNKTRSLTVKELKSSSILKILNKKQSWGQAYASKGKYIRRKRKIYTKKYFDRIKVVTSKKIKYLNKIFYLCNDK